MNLRDPGRKAATDRAAQSGDRSRSV